MNTKQVERFVMRYLEATGCGIIEKTPDSVTVKLSPDADRELTGRSYYWGFVERTGAPPETMTLRFLFRPEAPSVGEDSRAPREAATLPARTDTGETGGAVPGAAGQPSDSILGRYFGITLPSPIGRIPTDTLTFGSRRLEQIFDSSRKRGSFVRLFEDYKDKTGPLSAPYDTWLCVNYKVELVCDMKREECHSLGINLITGEKKENFYESVRGKKLVPRIPASIHLKPIKWTFNRAAHALEDFLEKRLRTYDHSWADQAKKRLEAERQRIDGYYLDLLNSLPAESEEEAGLRQQYNARAEEADWQYQPKIRVSAINCGLFHLQSSAELFGNG
ncbi:YqhG family protein [Gorillibacterium massiliense]|uniref:YqhG family protein n=1 Tax=Gorillibacterium massiliense TaxID=1280390 RepID=UPI0004AD6AD3|nr:YqhG family protein [Gorillibacterium massiliense]